MNTNWLDEFGIVEEDQSPYGNGKPRNIILEKSLEFALEIIEYCEGLQANKKYVISNQLLKSGTSIGANVREAQNAESKADFIHKLKIAAKEAEETEYWLILCERSKNYPSVGSMMKDIKVIILILGKIISTAKSNSNK